MWRPEEWDMTVQVGAGGALEQVRGTPRPSRQNRPVPMPGAWMLPSKYNLTNCFSFGAVPFRGHTEERELGVKGRTGPQREREERKDKNGDRES